MAVSPSFKQDHCLFYWEVRVLWGSRYHRISLHWDPPPSSHYPFWEGLWHLTSRNEIHQVPSVPSGKEALHGVKSKNSLGEKWSWWLRSQEAPSSLILSSHHSPGKDWPCSILAQSLLPLTKETLGIEWGGGRGGLYKVLRSFTL